MREITTHRLVVEEGQPPLDRANAVLIVEAQEDHKSHGAPTRYSLFLNQNGFASPLCSVRFHAGPLRETLPDGSERENPVTGLTHEGLLAILIDRLEGFQKGRFVCDDNEQALAHLRKALSRLQARTRKRAGRGVGGVHQP